MTPSSSRKKILLLGLDAADLPFIRSRLSQLGTLGTALKMGRLFEPESPRVLSGSVWPTFYLGCDPGEHGIYQHQVWDADRMGLRVIAPTWCQRKSFWADLEARGHDVVVLDVPLSFPISLQRGVEISSWASHDQSGPNGTNRPEIKSLMARFGPSPMGRESPIRKSRRQLDRIRRQLIQSASLKGQLTLRLMRDANWDILLSVFGETHRAGHLFFFDDDAGASNDPTPALLEIYRAVDAAVGEIVKAAGEDTTVVLFAVHGMMPDSGQGHIVQPVMDRINDAFLKKNYGISPSNRTRGGIIRWARKRLPAFVQNALADAASDKVRQWVVERQLFGGVNWSKTPGFGLRADVGSAEVRLNIAGRERLGFLQRNGDQHRSYIKLFHDTLYSLQDKTSGEKLVEDVVDIHRAFPGQKVGALPEFSITWRPQPAASEVHSPYIGTVAVSHPGARAGDHRDSGFAVLLGPQQSRDDLPPLSRTAQFSRFISDLADWNRVAKD